MVRGEEISVINPIVMGASSAVQALEALFASTQTSPASSSGGAFSTGQGLPTTQGANAQAAPSNASNKFAPSTLNFLTALQDPESAAAGFASGAESAIGQDISSIGSVLEKLKTALTGAASGSSSAAATALSVGSAAATQISVATTSIAVGALGQLTSGLAALFGDSNHMRHHHHHGGGMGVGSASSTGSTGTLGASALSMTSSVAGTS
jgi:hypothetical protein